jgi:hypothetical protein
MTGEAHQAVLHVRLLEICVERELQVRQVVLGDGLAGDRERRRVLTEVLGQQPLERRPLFRGRVRSPLHEALEDPSELLW